MAELSKRGGQTSRSFRQERVAALTKKRTTSAPPTAIRTTANVAATAGNVSWPVDTQSATANCRTICSRNITRPVAVPAAKVPRRDLFSTILASNASMGHECKITAASCGRSAGGRLASGNQWAGSLSCRVGGRPLRSASSLGNRGPRGRWPGPMPPRLMSPRPTKSSASSARR